MVPRRRQRHLPSVKARACQDVRNLLGYLQKEAPVIANSALRCETFEMPLKLTGGLSAEEADRWVALAVRAGDVGARALAFYLADIADRGIYQQFGFHSIELYAEARYHLRPSTTRQYVAAGRALQELPGVDREFRRGGLFWSQVRELIRVATPETEDEWVMFARGRTARQIAAEVARRRKGDRPADKRRRRIHEAWFRPDGSLRVLKYQYLLYF